MSQATKPTVLVVDDQHPWRDLLVRQLDDEYDVVTASSYREAVEVVLKQEVPFHVVITDIRLVEDEETNEEGLDLLDVINGLTNYTKTIVVTANAGLRTARRALRDQKVVDYIDKSDWNLDPAYMQALIRNAAQEAQKQRPEHIVRTTHQLLVANDDAQWAEELAMILREDHYLVDTCNNVTDLRTALRSTSYSLIIVDIALTEVDPSLLYSIREFQHNTQILLTTTVAQLAAASEAVQDRKIYGLVVFDELFDEQHFRLKVQRALAPLAQYYVVVTCEDLFAGQHMLVDHTYRLVLTLQSLPDPDGIAIRFFPKDTREPSILAVFLYVPDMDVRPGQEVYWEIPSEGIPRQLTLNVTPRSAGKKRLVIDFEEGDAWLNRWYRDVEVIADR